MKKVPCQSVQTFPPSQSRLQNLSPGQGMASPALTGTKNNKQLGVAISASHLYCMNKSNIS